ncbi:MAG: FAD-dependent oxidoreductase [Methanomicrobiales archaeon]|nr:FAD-dependent oxidoreductase [Methanomicrobiales archaeon]
MPQVTVYSTKNCPYCRMAKAFLEKHSISYISIDVGEDEEAAKHMIAISGQRGVPVITIDTEIIVGFDAQRLNEIFGTGTEGDILDVVIIGAGPAGLTAAVYCARKLLTAVVITENIGGQALESWTIENYMGYRMITGDELMKKFEGQVKEQKISLELDQVREITPSDGIFRIHTATDTSYLARAIILAPGKQPKKLGVEGEERFLGRGLSVCSTCDGPLFKNKVVAIVGGGNSALQTAVEMSKIAKEVHLIVRSTIRADEVYVKLFEAQKNIILHSNSVVSALHGDKLLDAITIKDRLTSVESNIMLDGVFAEIGWSPNTDFVSGLVKLNDQKEIMIDINCHTSVPGIFAAGDVTNIKGKQIIIAAGEGAKAALEAYDYLVQL